MASVSPLSSISQSVSTTGGSVFPPPLCVLENLEPLDAARLLMEYYAAVKAGSAEVGGSVSVSSRSSRKGRRERAEVASGVAAKWRSVPGYCYTRLLADSKVGEKAAALGPNPSLEVVCGLREEDLASDEVLQRLSVTREGGAYHVSDRDGESVPSFFARCASLRRGSVPGRLLGHFGMAPFGVRSVDWGSPVGVDYADVVKAEWTVPTEPGLFGYVLDSRFKRGQEQAVFFPPRAEECYVYLAVGAEAKMSTGVVQGPAWLPVSRVSGLAAHFVCKDCDIVYWWGTAIGLDLGVAAVGGAVTGTLVPKGSGLRVEYVSPEVWSGDIAVTGGDQRITCDVAGERRTFRIPAGLPGTTFTRNGYKFVSFPSAMGYAMNWRAVEGYNIPLSFHAVAGVVIDYTMGSGSA